jgi:hypothetical protein
MVSLGTRLFSGTDPQRRMIGVAFTFMEQADQPWLKSSRGISRTSPCEIPEHEIVQTLGNEKRDVWTVHVILFIARRPWETKAVQMLSGQLSIPKTLKTIGD